MPVEYHSLHASLAVVQQLTIIVPGVKGGGRSCDPQFVVQYSFTAMSGSSHPSEAAPACKWLCWPTLLPGMWEPDCLTRTCGSLLKDSWERLSWLAHCFSKIQHLLLDENKNVYIYIYPTFIQQKYMYNDFKWWLINLSDYVRLFGRNNNVLFSLVQVQVKITKLCVRTKRKQ